MTGQKWDLPAGGIKDFNFQASAKYRVRKRAKRLRYWTCVLGFAVLAGITAWLVLPPTC